jgi:predicted kinase
MLVHDPWAHQQRPLEHYIVESRSGDTLTLRSSVPTRCFVLNTRTGESVSTGLVVKSRLQDSFTVAIEETLTSCQSPLEEGVDDPAVLKAVFVCGAGGSGKTKIADTMFAGLGFKSVNQDTHLEKILAKAKIPLSQVGMHYGLQKKAQKLKNAELRQYGLRRLGLVIDATGWDYARIADPAKQLMKLGYDVFMVFVSTSLDTALRRNKGRERIVPDDFIKTAHAGAHKNLPEYQKLLGKRNVFVIKNDTDFSEATWNRIVAPALRKLGAWIAKAKIQSKRGKEWLQAREKSGEDTVDAKEWPKPAEPAPLIPLLPAAKKPVKKPTKESSTPRKWMVPSVLEADGIAVPPQLTVKVEIGTYAEATVYLVDGDEVREYLTDFIGGGHGYAYPGIIGKDEIWVERMPSWLDTAAIAVHEMIEYTRMKLGKQKYIPAHHDSNDAESIVRALFKMEVKESLTEAEEKLKTVLVSTTGEPMLMYYFPNHRLGDIATTGDNSVYVAALGAQAPGDAFTHFPESIEQGWSLPVYLKVQKPIDAKTVLTAEQIGSLITASPRFDESVAEPDPEKRLAKAVAAAMKVPGALGQICQVWSEWYADYQASVFAEAVVALGFDSAVRRHDGGNVTAVVFDPGLIVPTGKTMTLVAEVSAA